MERSEWLREMRRQAEAIYDRLAPEYWVRYGLYSNATHLLFLKQFLQQIEPGGAVLDAACGAGRYSGILLEAGHPVTGADQSAQMLERARQVLPSEQFPGLTLQKVGLQELDFAEEFAGIICMDALEHVCPEDWPGILSRFWRALKPGGRLYFTVELPDPEEVRLSYEQAISQHFPVVAGEVVDITDDQVEVWVYHYYPSLEQVRLWLQQAGFILEPEGSGDGYAHFLAARPD